MPLRLVAAGALALALTLSGCARPVGDFGRAEVDPLHDTVMPAIGTARATAMQEPVSAFNLTDQEQEMRDRIWRYLVSPNAYDWFADSIAELQRTRIMPAEAKKLRKDRYYNWLHGEKFASSHVRYARIGDDTAADLAMLPDAFRSICAVLEVDRERGVAANQIKGLDEATKTNAAARWSENHSIIDGFVRALRHRYESYNYALDHLLVETPHPEAVAANAGLTDLDVFVEAAEAGDFCTDRTAGHEGREPEVRSRYLRTTRTVMGS